MRRLLAGTLLVSALALAGCGSSSSPGGTTHSSGEKGNGEAAKSGQQVFTDAVQAAKGASSFHMSGQISLNGQPIDVDLSIVKGQGATGWLKLNGQKLDLVVVGADAYVKADAAFYSQYGGSVGRALGPSVAGKWLKFPRTNPQFGPITSIADANLLFDSLTVNHGALTNEGETTYEHQSVVAIHDSAKGGTLYVAATGTPYPVALVKSGVGVSTSFDKWGESVTLTPPSGAIDISQFVH